MTPREIINKVFQDRVLRQGNQVQWEKLIEDYANERIAALESILRGIIHDLESDEEGPAHVVGKWISTEWWERACAALAGRKP